MSRNASRRLALYLIAAVAALLVLSLVWRPTATRRLTERQVSQLRRALKPLTPQGWRFDVKRSNPYRLRSTKPFPGAVFAFTGPPPPRIPRVKQFIPAFNVIVVPRQYRPELTLPPGLVTQVTPPPPKYIGRWRGLAVYSGGLRPVPDTGPLSKATISKALRITADD